MAEKYSIKTEVPQYIPKGNEPKLKELYNIKKYNNFIKEIEETGFEDEELKQFLLFSATRFIEFNFSKIAEYYCHQDKTVQEIMEKLALVIIDFDDAIKYGYADLSQRIKDIIDKQETEELVKT